jgi:hypothetical protein
MQKNLTFFQTSSKEDIRTTNGSLYSQQSENPFIQKRTRLAFIYILSFFISLLGRTNFIYAQIANGFELDGNATAVAPNPPDDWSMIYSSSSNAQVTTGIDVDMPSNADNAFVIGSKDINDVSTWHWQTFSVPDKDDILHAFAALYGNTKLYFGGDRYAVNGDAQIGFWFFQNAVGTLPNGTFSGTHAIGDILILSDFVNGGGVPVVKAYEWVGSGGSDGSLNQLAINGPNIYAIVNNAIQSSPWSYLSKTGSTSFEPGAFYEGGLDLAALNVNIDPCFTSFLLETRSSQSATAELKDFLWGNFFTRPQVTVNSATICPGGSATLNATVTGGTAPYTYSWSNGATTSSITVSPSSTTSYTVIITAANGCQSNPVTGTVTVNPAPVCNVGSIVPANLICNHGNYTISTTSSGTLSWSMTVDGNPPGWGIVGSNTSQTITFSSGNCGASGFLVHFFLTVSDGNGCSSSCSADFAPGAPACAVDIRPAITLTCATTSQWLLASYATDIVNPAFEWTLNSTTSLGAGVNDGVNLDSILISAPGLYTFWVHDPSNPANDCSGQVTVQQDTTSPGAGATGGNLTCTTTSVQLTGSTTSGTQFDWTGPNGFSSSQQDPTVTDAGNYTLVVTNPTNGCTSSAQTTVTIDTVSPGAGATGGNLTCTATSVQLTGSTTSGTQFDWTGPNGFSSGQQNPTVTDAGNYTLVVTNPTNGCTSSAQTTVTIDTVSPGAGATGGNLTCTTTSVQLTGSTTSGTQFDWTGPNGFSSGQQNPTVTDAGNFTLVVTNPTNGCTSSAQTTVTIDTVSPGAGATGGNLTCTTTSVQLTGSTTSGTQFDWTGPNGFSSGQQNPTVTDAGNYTLVVTNPTNGCTSSAQTTVTIDTVSPGAGAIGGNLTCTTTSVQLTGSTTSGTQFDWTGPNGFSSGLQNPTATDAGNYTLVVTNSTNGCTSSASTTVTIDTVSPGAGATGGNLTCTTTSVQLTGSTTSGTQFDWTGPNGFSSSQQNPTVTAPGSYILVVTNPGNGCTSSASTNVSQDTIAPTCGLSAPNTLPICGSTGNTLSVTASSNSGNVDYAWSVIGTGWIITSAANGSSITYTAGSGTATFTVVITDPASGCTSSCSVTLTCTSPFAGCTLGFWKNHPSVWYSASQSIPSCVATAAVALGYGGNGTTTASFAATFGLTSGQMSAAGYNTSLTLRDALGLGGGGFNKLARQGVASLLNSCSFSAYFPYSTTQVLTDMHNAIANLTPEPQASVFASANEVQPEMCPSAGPASPNRPEANNHFDEIMMSAYPNPFASAATIEFTLNSFSSYTEVEVFSVTGAKVATLFKGEVMQDELNKVTFDASSVAGGMYFCRIAAGNTYYYLRLIVMKDK